MSQYQVGTIEVTNGNRNVTAVDPLAPDTLAAQEWVAEVQSGDLFYVEGDPVSYVISSVFDDTTLTLASDYQGTTIVASGSPLAGKNYAIHRDFSTNYAFPVPNQGDIGLPVMLQQTIIDFDNELKQLDDRVVALEP